MISEYARKLSHTHIDYNSTFIAELNYVAYVYGRKNKGVSTNRLGAREMSI